MERSCDTCAHRYTTDRYDVYESFGGKSWCSAPTGSPTLYVLTDYQDDCEDYEPKEERCQERSTS